MPLSPSDIVKPGTPKQSLTSYCCCFKSNSWDRKSMQQPVYESPAWVKCYAAYCAHSWNLPFESLPATLRIALFPILGTPSNPPTQSRSGSLLPPIPVLRTVPSCPALQQGLARAPNLLVMQLLDLSV